MSEQLTSRHYTKDDIDSVVEIVQREIPQLPSYQGLTVEPERVRWWLSNNVTNSRFLCVILCDSHNVIQGGVAGLISPSMFNSKVMVSQDLFLFVMPEHRTLRNVSLLIETYKNWAKVHNCELITASQASGYKVDKLDILLRRLGFVQVGHNYHLSGDK
jgi:hypothetical protein